MKPPRTAPAKMFTGGVKPMTVAPKKMEKRALIVMHSKTPSPDNFENSNPVPIPVP